MRLAHLLLVAAACAPTASRDRAWVGADVARRTGHAVGPRAPDDSLPPGARLDDGVTEDEAVAIALWRNATYQADLAHLGIARADLVAAGVPNNPTISPLVPIGAGQVEIAFHLVTDWLFARGRRVAAAQLDLQKVADELVQHGLDLARDARAAHADAELADRRVELAASAATTWAEIARLSERRFEAGDTSRTETEGTRAQSASAAAEVGLRRAEASAAHAHLAELLGATSPITVVAADPVAAPPDRDALLARARAARPDLQAARLAVAAAAERAGVARARVYTVLTALDAKLTGGDLSVGGEVTLPIFDRGQEGRARAAAEADAAAWHYVEVQRAIEAELLTAHARLDAAAAALSSWRVSVVLPATEALRLAREGFMAGAEPYLTVLEAVRRLEEAQQREAELDADAHKARAELLRAVGGSFDAPSR